MIAGYVFCPHLLTPVASVTLAGRNWVKPEVSYPTPLACPPHPSSKSIVVAEGTACGGLLLQPEEQWWESRVREIEAKENFLLGLTS